MVTEKQIQDFINDIAPIIQREAKSRGYLVASPVIAQACCESAFGTSYKAQHHNYFGLKYRKNRCPSASGTFVDGGSEQQDNGQYIPITDQWFEFTNMENGVKGYYEFISIPNYNIVRNADTPKKYLEALKQCGYATSKSYVNTNMNIVKKYKLTRFDNLNEVESSKQNNRPSIFDRVIKQPEKQNNDKTELKIGDRINISRESTYYNGKEIPSWVKKSILYYRGKNINGYIFSTQKTGPITGVVDPKYVSKV
jgi:hypothetical protein